MSEDTGKRAIRAIYIPENVRHPSDIWKVLDQVIGQTVRMQAHDLWHKVDADQTLHPTERTIELVKVQAFLDYADEIDPTNTPTTESLLGHFGWKLL